MYEDYHHHRYAYVHVNMTTEQSFELRQIPENKNAVKGRQKSYTEFCIQDSKLLAKTKKPIWRSALFPSLGFSKVSYYETDVDNDKECDDHMPDPLLGVMDRRDLVAFSMLKNMTTNEGCTTRSKTTRDDVYISVVRCFCKENE